MKNRRDVIDRRKGKKPCAVTLRKRGARTTTTGFLTVVVTRAEAEALGLEFKLPTYTVRSCYGTYTREETVNADGSHLVEVCIPDTTHVGDGVNGVLWWRHPHGSSWSGRIRDYKPDGHRLGYGLRKVEALRRTAVEDMELELADYFSTEPEPMTHLESSTFTVEVEVIRTESGAASCQLVAA